MEENPENGSAESADVNDLSWFRFNVHRFMNSPDVDRMDASEVGQYTLLLCKSWAIGDECKVPDDLEYLARIARVPQLSDRVLAKFPVVGEGFRRNKPLHDEWVSSHDLHKKRQDALAKARETRWAQQTSETDDCNSNVRQAAVTNERTIHNKRTNEQTNETNAQVGGSDALRSGASDEAFRICKKRYFQKFGKWPKLTKKNQPHWDSVYADHGDKIVDAFILWVDKSTKKDVEWIDQPLSYFLTHYKDWLEALDMKPEATESSPVNEWYTDKGLPPMKGTRL